MLPNDSAGDARWWRNPATVQGFVHGVFEGGGLKGILYVGALEGVLKRKIWFSAVAGSSAGAITAAMIAAGLRPEDLRREMEQGIEAMALPTWWNGYRRLRKAAGFLDQDSVRGWLRRALGKQAVNLGGANKQAGPSFKELFALTDIDLYVVAADLSARRLIVFSRTLTPDANVADSVMASACIPAAFEPLVFETDVLPTLGAEKSPAGSTRRRAYRLIADGGIGSNFPSFVFRDDGFRKFAKLDPVSEMIPVVGFLLDEDADASTAVPEAYKSGQFTGTLHDIERERAPKSWSSSVPQFRRRPRRNRETGSVTESSSDDTAQAVRVFQRSLDWLLFVSELAVLKPVLWLGKGFEHSTWWNLPPSTNRHVRLWTAVIQSLISTSPLPFLAGVAVFSWIFWVGLSAVSENVFASVEFQASRTTDFYDYVGLAFELLLSAMALVLAVWVFLLGVVTLAVLRVAYPTLGVLGYPLMTTFLQTPAAPPWAGEGRNETVIRLKVPPGLRTLGAGPGTNVSQALLDAEKKAYDELKHVALSADGRIPKRGAPAEFRQPYWI